MTEQSYHSRPDVLVGMTVHQIMAERGVGQKQAYDIKRKAAMETVGEVPTNQRERVLSVLQRHNGDIRTSRDLTEVLHSEGFQIDGHDTTKTLWSLQKTGHVKFRERQNPRFLYAIKLTEVGWAIRTTDVPGEEDLQLSDPIDPPLDTSAGFPAEVPLDVDDGIRLVYSSPFDNSTRPPTSLGGWPAIRHVRDRARRAEKLTAAVKLLEEAGGADEMALDLMSQTEFTPLEEEVIELLKRFGEL